MTQRKAKWGEAQAFLKDSLDTVTDDCIEWPFPPDKDGYGNVKHEGRLRPAHRVALILHTGIDPEHLDACHEPIVCHNNLCINVKHLRWDTRSNNLLDRQADGTGSYIQTRGQKNKSNKLTEQQVLLIAANKGSHAATARLYGVGETTVKKIRTGQTWSWLTNKENNMK